LVGRSMGNIENSSAKANVSGDDLIGGLVGDLGSDATISYSYATGNVTGDDDLGGLIGNTASNVTITYSHASGNVFDVEINADPKSGSNMGGLVGDLGSGGTISYSYATGNVTGEDNLGGLIGNAARNVTITYSRATGNVTGNLAEDVGEDVGGFVGEFGSNGTISYSYAIGDVIGNSNVGGLVGLLEEGASVTYSYATGDVIGNDDVGGLVGHLETDASATHSYATGNVNGDDEVGGLVGYLETDASVTHSYATGNVNGDDEVGGLVGYLETDASVTHSYATGDVIGNDDVGGLVGYLETDASVTHSYATGDVIGNLSEGDGGDVGGLVGIAYGIISNSYATGDVSGIYDVGGLVGDLNSDGVIRNSYATGDVTASGFNDDWESGWGGLVGEFDGIIENSYATGNVLADYHAGSLVGYFRLSIESEVRYNVDSGSLEPMITNSFATGVVMLGTRSILFELEEDRFFGSYEGQDIFVEVNHDNWALVFGGFIGCQEGGFLSEEGDPFISCSADELTQSTPTAPPILSVVNTVGTAGAPAFEIEACKNNGLPLISLLSASYANTCAPNPAPASLSAALASAVQLNPKFNLLESTTLRLFLYLVGDKTIRITVEDFVVLGATGVNSKNLPLLLKLLKDVDLLTLDLNTINKNVKIANEILKKKKIKPIRA
jgi:hypothetical protein